MPLQWFSSALEILLSSSLKKYKSVCRLFRTGRHGNALVGKEREYFTLGVGIKREREILPLVVFSQVGIRMLPAYYQQLEFRVVFIFGIQRFLNISKLQLARRTPCGKQTYQYHFPFQVCRSNPVSYTHLTLPTILRV